MANIDKNQAVIDYLLTCPQIQANPLYFNFLNAKDGNKQLITSGNDKTMNKPYIDGSVLKRYTFTIIDYRSLTYDAIVKPLGTSEDYANENVEEAFDVQGVIDWISEQNDLRNFPNFGDTCEVDEIKTLTENPNLNGVDTSITPALAKYSMSIQVDYIDKSKVIW